MCTAKHFFRNWSIIMNMITTDGFEAGLASKKTDSLISKMVSAWESKNAKSAAKVSGLTLMAVSLAACGGSSSDDASGGGDDASGDDCNDDHYGYDDRH